ncbi:VWA domain-containing protein [Nocardioides zeae]|uniref:VWA domain-containing protein n=1 Tax=Nocardioides imazamoxiresistens TaxID=3231893 RepID=A0ABU3PXQ4_9ACTN|nr:VWA domain-containing protein [Nocardioides zeae]MDT9594022.1 VWA domain-containing protein [Nocardioides zeae]
MSVAAPDLVRELTGLAAALRRAGVGVPSAGVATTVDALAALGTPDRSATYWAGRLTLCSGPDDLGVYDQVFDLWFSRAEWAGDVHRGTVVPTYRDAPEHGDEADAASEEARTAPPTASRLEVLRHRDVAELEADDRRLVHTLVRRLALRPALRRARRARSSTRGRTDVRRVVREAVRTGGEPVRWHRRRAGVRTRRVVLLLDVSGSMRRYAETYLLLGHALVRSAPGSEVFSIGTRLTRLTGALGAGDPQRSVEAVAQRVADWSGGTRLGDQVKAFLDGWGCRGLARGAVVVVLSDGWERGDATLLGEQMARLQRLAHRVVWVNPNRARPGYEPATAGLRAALPHVDAFVDGHSLAALEALVDEIARGGRRA